MNRYYVNNKGELVDTNPPFNLKDKVKAKNSWVVYDETITGIGEIVDIIIDKDNQNKRVYMVRYKYRINWGIDRFVHHWFYGCMIEKVE